MNEFHENGKLEFVPPAEWRTDLIRLKTTPMELSMAVVAANKGVEWCRELREKIEMKYQPTKFDAKKRITQYARDLIYNSIRNGV